MTDYVKNLNNYKIRKIKQITDSWLLSIHKFDIQYPDDVESVLQNTDLIEIKLQSLLKQLDFNPVAFLSEFGFFEYRPGRKHLSTCIKSFNLSVTNILLMHGLIFKNKIRSLEEQILGELIKKEKSLRLKKMWQKMDPSDDIFSEADKNIFGNDNKWMMTYGGYLTVPSKILIPFPFAAISWAFNDYYYYTDSACAEKAPEFLLAWEKNVLELLMNQIRKETVFGKQMGS